MVFQANEGCYRYVSMMQPRGTEARTLTDYPRVLVISANALSQNNNNGITMETFFAHWPSDRIAQIYFRPEISTSRVCQRFFRITDADIVASRLGHHSAPGSDVEPQNSSVPFVEPNGVYSSQFKDWHITRLFRECLWLGGVWDTPALQKWISAFTPEVIFLCAGGDVFQHTIAKTLAARLNIPIIVFITDDYVLPRFSLSPAYWLRLLWIRSKFIPINKSAADVFSICEEMARVYQTSFGFPSQVAANTVQVSLNPPVYKPIDLPIRLVYTGSVHSNRWKSLVLLGRSLDSLSSQGIECTLDIYTATPPSLSIIRKLSTPKHSTYRGALDNDGVKRAQRESDILVHVESFDAKSRHYVRLSLSTKIPEYLATGKCIFAIGPAELASIKYLLQTQSGTVVTTAKEADIIAALHGVLKHPEEVRAFGERAWQTARNFHQPEHIRGLITASLRTAVAVQSK